VGEVSPQRDRTTTPAQELLARDDLHVWVSNIGGAGMSAVATLFAEQGHAVSGHDPASDTPFLAPMRALGVTVHTGSEHPPLPDDVDVVVTSTATPEDVVAVAVACRRGLPVWHRSAALAALCASRTTVAVAGTHGKSTTAAMLATILVGVVSGTSTACPHGSPSAAVCQECDDDRPVAEAAPGWVVGAPIPGLGRSATWGREGPLVVEADESDGTFLALPATVALVTNVEPDHLEHYGDFDRLVDAFRQFLTTAPRQVVCADDPVAADLARDVGATTYGTDATADHRIEALTTGRGGVSFRLTRDDGIAAQVELAVPGVHNARNAAAALVAAAQVGVPIDVGAAALKGFAGVARRFELRGEWRGATLIDSYDHLPGEVAAVLRAAREGGWPRVVCVFQPHRYSRTEALWSSFADAFQQADLLAVTDVYAAGEPERPGVSGKLVVDAVLEAHPWRHVAYLPRLDDVVAWLRTVLRPGDLCLTLGAGDLTTVPSRLIEAAAAAGGQPGAAHP
jgi:UDP-N-acetylmuramate--alanine ligase